MSALAASRRRFCAESSPSPLILDKTAVHSALSQACGQQLLGQLAAFAAVGLSLAEELRELVVAGAVASAMWFCSLSALLRQASGEHPRAFWPASGRRHVRSHYPRAQAGLRVTSSALL